MASKRIRKIKVAVIFGGRSGEHEVSVVSGQSVMKALDKKKYQVVPIGITRQGKWLAGGDAIKYLKSEIKKLPAESYLPADPTRRELVSLDNKSSKATPVDVVFPVLHGTYGEDGTIQGLFEMANVPYVGSGVLGSALGMDKVVQKQLIEHIKIPVIPYVWLTNFEWQKKQQQILKDIKGKFSFPMFTKPANLGSSVGVMKIKQSRQLSKGINLAFKYDSKVIVEQSLEDVREIECSVIGDENPRASVVGEREYSAEFFDYNAKYMDSSFTIPARISKKTDSLVKEISILAFKVLNTHGVARVDFFLTKSNKLYFNELNTMPGFDVHSMNAELWRKSGVRYTKLLDMLIQFAIDRHKQKNKLVTDYKSGSDWYKNK